MDQTCTKCKSQSKLNLKLKSSFMSSLLIIVIPKCPFCVMAYSSAVTMCGGKSLYMSQNNWISYIPLILSAVILYILVRNYRGQRTLAALVLAAFGSAMLIAVHQLAISSSFYNLGAALIIFAIWLNGSLLSFVSNLKNRIESRKSTWHV